MSESKYLVKSNSIPSFLWAREVESEIVVDDRAMPHHIKGKSVESDVVAATFFEIFFLKYGLVVLLVWLLGNASAHYHTYIGFGLGAIFYYSFSFIHKRWGAEINYIIAFILFASYAVFALLNFELSAKWGVGQILNYSLQYSLIFYVFGMLLRDYFYKGYKDYYRIKSLKFRYFRFVDDIENNEKKGKDNIYFKFGKYFVIFFSFIILAFGLLDFNSKYQQDLTVKKKVEERLAKRDLEFKLQQEAKKSGKIFYTKKDTEKLDGESEDIHMYEMLYDMNLLSNGMLPHKDKTFFGKIGGYAKVQVTKGASLSYYETWEDVKNGSFLDAKIASHNFNALYNGIMINKEWYVFDSQKRLIVKIHSRNK